MIKLKILTNEFATLESGKRAMTSKIGAGLAVKRKGLLDGVRVLLMSSDFSWFEKVLEGSPLFSAEYYAQVSGIYDATEAIEHYFSEGWASGLDPSPHFSTLEYLKLNPDVAAVDINPLFHYLKYGSLENRFINKDFNTFQFLDFHPEYRGRQKDPLSLCIEIYGTTRWRAVVRQTRSSADDTEEHASLSEKILALTKAGFFSEDYYLSYYSDIARAGVDPFRHYIESGWREHRNPSERFDTHFYSKNNPDVAAANDCPLLHYVEHGRAEMRAPIPSERVIFDLSAEHAALGEFDNRAVRLGVHAHVFFPELIGELYLALQSLPASTRVIFTTVHAGDRRFVENFLKHRNPAWTYQVKLSPRKGRDIGPLFSDCAELWASTDYLLNIHSKRSLHSGFGDEWRRYLFDQCVGSPALINRIVTRFEVDKSIAMLYPENFFEIKKFVGLNGNEAALSKLCEALGYSLDVMRVKDFAAGSMCWLRTSAYTDLVDYIRSFDAFGGEEKIEGTLAHVMERAFVAVALGKNMLAKSYSTSVRQALDYKPVARELPIYYDKMHGPRWVRDTPRIAVNEPKALAPNYNYYNPKSLDIHWVIPSFGPGAGGHMTIFRFVQLFEKFGHRQTIWIQNANNYRAPIDALRTINSQYLPLGDKVFVRFLPDSPKQLSGDVIIATDCWTAYPVASATNFKERFYFIQDYESEFHPSGANRLIATRTYDFGFAGLCAGPWLLGKAQGHGMWARQWELAADPTYYHMPATTTKRTDSAKIDIAFYSRTNTPRRAVELGLAAFEELGKRGLNFEVHFFGSDGDVSAEGYVATNHHILSPQELGDLYRRCDIGVVFSTTNYSLIPLEMMACGLPVVDLDVESVRAVFSADELVMAEPTPIGIANQIARLIESPSLRAGYSERGLSAVQKFDWEKSARKAEEAIYERLSQRKVEAIDPETICAPNLLPTRKASVFIPVKDGGAFFERVIDRILAQKADFMFDFLVIDSGSTDGTVDLLKRKAKADSRFRFQEIPNTQFQHGRTRNLGIEQTDGEYVAITTADALPADDSWLANLVGAFKKGPRIAGATGRHLPYESHGPFLLRDFNGSFNHFRDLGDVFSFEDQMSSQVYPGGVEWQMISQFYSDNNSAMSRAVWKKIPYPEIDWGEDMVWAWECIKLGFQKAYADDAVVYHSHQWDLGASEDWYAIEGRFWKELFGIEVVGNLDEELKNWNARDRLFAIKEKISSELLERQLALNIACLRGRARGIGQAKD